MELQSQVVELEKQLVVAEGEAQEEAGKMAKQAAKMQSSCQATEAALRETAAKVEAGLRELAVKAKAKAGQVKSKLIGDGMCLPQWRATLWQEARQRAAAPGRPQWAAAAPASSHAAFLLSSSSKFEKRVQNLHGQRVELHTRPLRLTGDRSAPSLWQAGMRA